jgi:hypothetical protein
MKIYLSILFALLSFNTFAVRPDGLTALWAQEYVGVDLTRGYLQTIKTSQELWTSNDVLLSLWDSSEDNHLNAVNHLALSRFDTATLPFSNEEAIRKKLLSTRDFRTHQVDIHEYLRLYQDFADLETQNNQCPWYISNSMNWYNNENVRRVFKSLKERCETTVFLAAGNSRVPLTEIQKKAVTEDQSTIIVTSLNSLGLSSKFSQYGTEILIAAPGNIESLSSIQDPLNTTEEFQEYLFGGTSAATPLVSSSIAAFSLITKTHLNYQEIVNDQLNRG